MSKKASRKSRKVRADARVSQTPITKKQFEDTLAKIFTQPVSDKQQKADQEAGQTSESRHSDDCNETRKSQDRIEGKEG